MTMNNFYRMELAIYGQVRREMTLKVGRILVQRFAILSSIILAGSEICTKIFLEVCTLCARLNQSITGLLAY